MNKIHHKNFIIFFVIIFFSYNTAFAEKELEVKKLYDLYAQDILDINQLNSALEKIDLNNENIKNLISLRKNGIILESDFFDGIKKVITNMPVSENKPKEDRIDIVKENSNIYKFQTEIISLHHYIVSDFKYGEIWNNMFSIVDNNISEIFLRDSKNIDLMKFSKPKIKLIKDNKFSIRSSVRYLTDPSLSLRYDFKGKFQDQSIIGEIEITYMGSEAPGVVLLKAKTK